MENVKTGVEKKETYINEYKKFKAALNYKFYLEAISIGYSIIEDRLVAFLHYLGIVTRYQERLSINTMVYFHMCKLLGKKYKANIPVKNISTKSDIIKKLINLDLSTARKIDNEVQLDLENYVIKSDIVKKGYMECLYCKVQSVINESSNEILNELDSWIDERNKFVHGLMNKKVTTYEEQEKECALKAYDLSRKIDISFVKKIKENNNIRIKFNIQ